MARALEGATYEELSRYGISRVCQINGFDRCSVQVFSAQRPPSDTICINSGKGLDRPTARAGAILEAIEFHFGDTPSGPFIVDSYRNLKANGVRVPRIETLPTCLDSLFTVDSHIAWDECNHLFESETVHVPSESIWLNQRFWTPLLMFQPSSNGQASGVSVDDALLSAVYELVERDAHTLSDFALDKTGIWPRRISRRKPYGIVEDVIDRMRGAGLSPYIFDLTTDLGIPVFGCYLFDIETVDTGSFSGFGCSLDAQTAIYRCLVEAAQARACYIAGARDDLFRRSFVFMKRADHKQSIQAMESLPVVADCRDYIAREFDSVESELSELKNRLESKGIYNIFWKELGKADVAGHDIFVVKAICPDLEGIRFTMWRPGPRVIPATLKLLDEARK